MKRVISILVLLLFISVPLGVTAERIDFSGLSLDALIMLKTWINEEIAERTKYDKAVNVPVGEYIIGADIPVGIYTLTINTQSAVLMIYSENGQLIGSHIMLKDSSDTIGKITLKNGQIIEIKGSPIVFSTYKGLSF
jgi:hypothetical protein